MLFWVLLFSVAAGAWAQTSQVSGDVFDASQSAIPGVRIAVTSAATGAKIEAKTGPDGTFVVDRVPLGRVTVEAIFAGFNPVRETFDLGPTGRKGWRIVLSTAMLSEQVNVAASSDLLQTSRATQITSISTREIQSIPTASRNYTHLIVAEAGVSAPLPDRTGRGMNIATTPGAQGDDGTQSLNPSVNGARPTNNSVAINGVDATNMMNANGSLGNNITVPLDALEAVEVQTALYSANTGRNGGGNIQMITRGGSNDFHGTVAHFGQNEKLNANEFFLNRAGTARPKFRREETSATLGGRILRDRTFFFLSAQRTDFTSGFANRAIAITGIPDGLGETRTRESIAEVANRWLQGRSIWRSAIRSGLPQRFARISGRTGSGLGEEVLRQHGGCQRARVPEADRQRHTSGGDQCAEREAQRPIPASFRQRLDAAPSGHGLLRTRT